MLTFKDKHAEPALLKANFLRIHYIILGYP